MSSWFISANRLIDSRYDFAPPQAARSASTSVRPIVRAATTTLVSRRFTSHSHGPGNVSSKSLRSKTRWRSGVPKRPKFSRWASPQAWTSMPVVGVVARSAAMTAGDPRR
jgi:hypothetical protein